MQTERILNICTEIKKSVKLCLPSGPTLNHLLSIVNECSSGQYANFNRLKADIDRLPLHKKNTLLPQIESLSECIQGIANCPKDTVDIVLLSALRQPELAEILELPVKEPGWLPFGVEGENQVWHRAALKRANSELSVVAGSPNEMGAAAMAVTATKAIIRWSPKIIVLCGIAAGVDGNASIGDVLLPNRVFVHDSGKLKDGRRKSETIMRKDSWTVSPDEELIHEIEIHNEAYFESFEKELSRFSRSLGKTEKCSLRKGPMASGNAVIDSEIKMDDITLNERKTIGVEMESYGFLLAVRECNPTRTRGVVLKSVSDLGMNKGDKFREYASWISARFAHGWIMSSKLI